MTRKPHYDLQGRKWWPYSVKFTSPEGTFSVEIYAISDLHADLQVQALRETAVLDGQILETIR